MTGIFQGKQGAEGDTHCYFPLYLYYGGIQRIPDDFIYSDLSAYFSSYYCIMGLSGYGSGIGRHYCHNFQAGFPSFPILCHYSHGVLHPPGICEAGLLDRKV